MVLALSVGLVTVAVAVLRGGSLRGLSETKFRWVPLLFAGLVVQIAFDVLAPRLLEGTGALAVVLLTNLAVAGFVLGNRKLPGMVLAGAGLALNVIVIASNGAMPVSPKAVAIADAPSLDAAGIKHERLTEETILPWLGDVIPLPGTGLIVSVGDVVLGAGIARLVYVRTTSSRRRPRHAFR